jgi:predicted  nucleic acid-binding Zn-ribbon protein
MATFDPWQQLKLLELANLDKQIAKSNYTLARLPLLQKQSDLKALAANLRQNEIVLITYIADLDLEISKVEEDVSVVRMRSSKDEELLISGSISDSKQLSELQHEVTSLKRRQNELEDAEMEVMEQQEKHNSDLKIIRERILENANALAEVEAQLAVESGEIQSQISVLLASRSDLVPTIDSELIDLYERIRVDNDGVGAALLQQRKCLSCGMQLSPTAVSEARAAATNELIRCEECRCILVRTDESGL